MKQGIEITVIQKAVKAECEYHGLPAEVVMGRSREKEFKNLRRRIQYVLIDLYILLPHKIGIDSLVSYEYLGLVLGGVDHSTMLDVKKKYSHHISIYAEDKKLFLETRRRMASSLGINIENETISEIEEVKLFWYHFRRAEKDYDVNKQAKYRKMLDDKLSMTSTAIQQEMINEQKTFEANSL